MIFKACCVVCQLVFCCTDCRWKHEKSAHGLTYECPICRGYSFLCEPKELNKDFIKHLFEEHAPLQCKKCNKYFTNMDDFTSIEECTSISELVPKEVDPSKSQLNEIDEKFDFLYDKAIKKEEGENFEAIVSVNKSSKTAVITPVVRKKTIVDYDSSESDGEERKNSTSQTPHPKQVPKTPKLKRQRVATPHAKKLLSLMRQKVVEEYEETVDENDYDGSPITNKTTPSRNENCVVPDNQKEMTTPTSHIQHVLKLAQIVTTSTPTHPVVGGWALFPEQSADSPLSEIENTESPAQNTNNDPSKSENLAPKLKSIIVTGSRIRLGSQDSSEKQVTFQESVNTVDNSSMKVKKVKFAEDTVFEQENKMKRVYRKPKRMLTPGPQKPRFCFNPRFQALINRFENQGQTVARTPVNNTRDKTPEYTPATSETHRPARAINFKEDSPVVETGNYSKESNEMFKTCVDSPTTAGINTAITALTTNIAGSLQNCLSSVLRTTEEETEIQFKFVITKKKVSVKRIADDGERAEEKATEFERNSDADKENIWSSVAKAVKNVFWGEQGNNLVLTPYTSCNSNESSLSSSSKRKCGEMTDPDMSPLNHKRHRYDGRIQGRPPLRRSKTWGVSSLRSSKSAEQQSLLKEVSVVHDDAMNQSF